ncbi:hypothetical protein JCM10021v2_000015 [Rhodotorula toruloides]
MDEQSTGMCRVCGRETKNRCSACGKAGIDLFFCSPEHQRLVWPGHRIFCGSNAFPIIFPLLSQAEAADFIFNLHTKDHEEVPVTRFQWLKGNLGRDELTEREVIDLICKVTEATKEPGLDPTTPMSQSLLLHSRFGRYIDTTCFRDHVVGLTANSYWTYQGQGIYPFGLPSELDKKGAETFHHILCLNTLDALRAGRSVYPEAEAIPAITVADYLATTAFETPVTASPLPTPILAASPTSSVPEEGRFNRHNNGLRHQAMASQTTGERLVCGRTTKNRCSRCLEAGIDLFFCSPDHQKLVWPLHRFFCGPGKANPWEWPPLSREEANYLLDQLPVSSNLSKEMQASEPDAVATYHRPQRDMKYAQLLHSMQNEIQKATLPDQGRIAFKLRATEYLYKKRRYSTVNALMTNLSPLTFFSHIADMLHEAVSLNIVGKLATL